MSDNTEPDDLIERLISMWSAGMGHCSATSHPGTPTTEHARELGHYMGETLYRLGTTSADIASPMTARKQGELSQGAMLEWFNATRNYPHQQTLAALAVLAELLHAAIEGVQGAGCDDLRDAHDLAVKLQECLASCAGSSGIVEGLRQMLIEAADATEE